MALTKMKVTLNLIKHINFNLFHNENEEEDLNLKIEHCEDYISDRTFINYSKKIGMNYYGTLEIESIIDSVLNVWNQDWRI